MLEDAGYACRKLLKNPGYTLATVLTLALGIGANTAIFSVIRGVLLRPLPYHHGSELVHVQRRLPKSDIGELLFSPQEVQDYRHQSNTLAGVVEYHSMAFNLLGSGEPDRVQTGVVSSNFLQEFGIEPLLGRPFRPQDEAPGAEPVLMLTYRYWRDRFSSDPGIVGKRLRMNDKPILVVGVLPPLPQYPEENKVFMPTAGCPFRSSEQVKSTRTARMVSLWARLKPGVAMDKAQVELTTIESRLQASYPEAYLSSAGATPSLVPLEKELTGRFRLTLFTLLGTVALVLLLACANVANLTLAQLLSRDREMVVRASLGASRGRLVRQLLTESLLVSLMGGVLGCLLASMGLNLLVAFSQRFTARADEIRIDGVVLLVCLGLSLVSGLLFGCIPALQSSRHDLASSLKEGGGRATMGVMKRLFRDGMVAVQVAISLVLLIGAGLMVRSLAKLQKVDPGFRPDNVLTATIELPFSKYGEGSQLVGFYQALLQRLSVTPGVVIAAVASDVPLASGQILTPALRIEGRPALQGQSEPRAYFHVVSEDYFRALEIPLVQGRTFNSMDHPNAPLVAVISQTLARQHWPDRNPIGQRIALGTSAATTRWRTIVGVVGDVKEAGVDTEVHPAWYVPFLQMPGAGTRLFVRTRSNPETILPDVQAAVHAIDPEQPIAEVQTLSEVYSASMAPARLTTVLLTTFAFLAFLITIIGISAAVNFSAIERIPESAIRLALGAEAHSVLTLLLRRAMTPVLIGLALGLTVAFSVTRLLSGLLFEIEPTDPLTLIGVLVVLLLAAGVACLLPAHRATRLDLVAVLRRS